MISTCSTIPIGTSRNISTETRTEKQFSPRMDNLGSGALPKPASCKFTSRPLCICTRKGISPVKATNTRSAAFPVCWIASHITLMRSPINSLNFKTMAVISLLLYKMATRHHWVSTRVVSFSHGLPYEQHYSRDADNPCNCRFTIMPSDAQSNRFKLDFVTACIWQTSLP